LSVARRFDNCPTTNPIRRELLNGLIVLVVASLLSVAFEAFRVTFDLQLSVLILTGIAIAVSGYLVLEFIRSANERAQETEELTRKREEEWLKRVGNPARLELGMSLGCRSPKPHPCNSEQMAANKHHSLERREPIRQLLSIGDSRAVAE
jgi:hypothetical protein